MNKVQITTPVPKTTEELKTLVKTNLITPVPERGDDEPTELDCWDGDDSHQE